MLGEHVCHAMRRFGSKSTTVLVVEYGTPRFIAMLNWSPSCSGVRALLLLVHRAGAVELVMAARVGEQREDRFGRRGDHALDGFGIAGFGHGRQRTLLELETGESV